jgi:trans-aconitate methyltransferase
MIDSNFIIQYTNSLYVTPVEYSPRYDEFRDMFSSGQIKSKEWLVEELTKLDPTHQGKRFIITGAWFGTLGMMIKQRFPGAKITMLDIDARCEKFIHGIIYNKPDMKCITEDMYKYHYTEDIIINTSCEHIDNIKGWISSIPSGKIVVLQSNDYIKEKGHINCVSSVDEFILQANLSEVFYSGKLEMPMYTRFMIIGKI